MPKLFPMNGAVPTIDGKKKKPKKHYKDDGMPTIFFEKSAIFDIDGKKYYVDEDSMPQLFPKDGSKITGKKGGSTPKVFPSTDDSMPTIFFVEGTKYYIDEDSMPQLFPTDGSTPKIAGRKKKHHRDDDGMPKIFSEIPAVSQMIRSIRTNVEYDSMPSLSDPITVGNSMPPLVLTKPVKAPHVQFPMAVDWLRDMVMEGKIILTGESIVLFAPSESAINALQSKLERQRKRLGAPHVLNKKAIIERHFSTSSCHSIDGTYVTNSGLKIKLDNNGRILEPKCRNPQARPHTSMASVGGVNVMIIEHDNIFPSGK
jgi:hypothetical protein